MSSAGKWQVKALGDLCEIARGGSPRPIQKFLTDAGDGINWIKISDATASSKYIYETKERIKPEGAKRSRMVVDGDFILSNSMSFGRPYIMKTSGCIHDGWLVLKDKSGLFDQDYLYYFLGSSESYSQFDKLAAGSTVRNLNIDLVKRVHVTVPPLSEQKRIVAILDDVFERIDTAIANTEKNIANARELFESYLAKVFTERKKGWAERRLVELGKIVTGSTPKTSHTGNYGTHIPFIKPGDFHKDGSLNYDNEGLSEIGAGGSRITDAESLLMVCIGATIGKTGYCNRRIATNQQINSLKPMKGVNHKFLYYQMVTKEFQQSVLDGSGQATLPIINKSKWSSLRVSIPGTIEEQESIVNGLDSLRSRTDSLESVCQNKLLMLNNIKQSLLQKAFSGELTADFNPDALEH